MWSHGESNVKEFVACMIQVIYTDLLLHLFLINLIESEILLDMLELLLKKDENHLINFNQLLPNEKSFFTILSPKIKNLKEVIKYLMDHNVNANCVDKFGETPLQHAIISNSIGFINSLIDSKKVDFSQRIFAYEWQ